MKHDNMDGDLAKLIALLKKILKEHPDGAFLAKLMDQKAFNLNLCFLTLAPLSPEELAEFEEMYEGYAGSDGPEFSLPQKSPKLEFKLSAGDIDFLKKNGIRF